MSNRKFTRRGAWRSPYVLFTALVAAIAAAFIGFAVVGDDGRQAAGQTESTSDACTDQPTRQTCYSIQVDDREWRYSLNEPAGRASGTAPAVLYDPGGPGIPALSGTYPLESLRDDLPDAVLFSIEEPWVTADISEACDQSVTDFYNAARSLETEAVSTSANRLWDACGLGQGYYGFSPEAYPAVVQAILERHDLELEGFVGHSFASARLSYLDDIEQVRPTWATVTRPFPIGATSDEILAERAALIGEYAKGIVVPSEVESLTADRSIATSEFDVWSALIELGYQPEASLESAPNDLAGPQAIQYIGDLSDALWSRYGTDSISPAILAQWEEICRVAGGTAAPIDDTGVAYVLWAMTAPCGESPAYPVGELTSESAYCFTSSNGDMVTPGVLVEQHLGGFDINFEQTRSHIDTEGAASCLDEVGGQDE